jgi:hypothetical protein
MYQTQHKIKQLVVEDLHTVMETMEQTPMYLIDMLLLVVVVLLVQAAVAAGIASIELQSAQELLRV